MDVFLTDTYLCKNCVRNRTVVQWICTISPSGDPPGRKVLGNVMAFTNSGNHQESILKDSWKHCVSNNLWPGGERESKSTMNYNTFRHFTKWFWGVRNRTGRILRRLFCFVSTVPGVFSLEDCIGFVRQVAKNCTPLEIVTARRGAPGALEWEVVLRCFPMFPRCFSLVGSVCKSTMKYNTFRHFTKWLWGFRDRTRRIPRMPFLLCFLCF